MPDTLKITGTLTAPYIPDMAEGSPRLAVIVKSLMGGGEQILATCSAQATGSPMPFCLCLDRPGLGGLDQVTLEARCTAGVGEDAVLARTTRNLAIADAVQGAPLALSLDAVGTASQALDKHLIQPIVIELTGQVSIPPDLRQAAAYLDTTLLVVQEDGYSNRHASNLAEHSMYLEGDGAQFSLFVDTTTVPEGRPVKLHLGLYDLDRKMIFAGNVIKNLDLFNPPDLSTIVLRKPRR